MYIGFALPVIIIYENSHNYKENLLKATIYINIDKSFVLSQLK
jgi:hypothetical protein